MLRTLLALYFLVGMSHYALAQTAGVAQPTVAPPVVPVEHTADGVPAADPPSSWSDPRVLAELVKNCRFDAFRDHPEWLGDIGAGSTNPLTCLSGRDQSCVPDPCFTDDDNKGCRGRCETTCQSCAKSCGDKCESCKAGCKDDSCRTSCAKHCATCRQGCVRAVDRCSSGKCSAEHDQCHARKKADWVRSGCSKVCAVAQKLCDKKCENQKGADSESEISCSLMCLNDGSSDGLSTRCKISLCRYMEQQ